MDAPIDYPKSEVAYAWQTAPFFLFLGLWQTWLIDDITLFPEPADFPTGFRILLTIALRAYWWVRRVCTLRRR